MKCKNNILVWSRHAKLILRVTPLVGRKEKIPPGRTNWTRPEGGKDGKAFSWQNKQNRQRSYCTRNKNLEVHGQITWHLAAHGKALKPEQWEAHLQRSFTQSRSHWEAISTLPWAGGLVLEQKDTLGGTCKKQLQTWGKDDYTGVVVKVGGNGGLLEGLK